jgi:nanoRNase/pAp phosphatase (c-di-AMP/oligoRNAs hydrolase)
MSGKYKIFTDCDLDGAGSYLVYKWFTQHDISVDICSQSNFKKTFESWLRNDNPGKYDKVYIMDLDVSQQYLNLVDNDNFIIIDHHETHVDNKDKYKKATTILKNYTSCCRLLYDLLKLKYPDVELTKEQKMLILLVDDYDSYKLKLRDSYNLNVVLWSMMGNRLQQFERDFGEGFQGFNQSHLNIIHLNNKKVHRLISELEIYKGVLPVSNKKYTVYATACSESINEIAHHIINSYECDICIIMNLKTGRVSFRKNKTSAPDLNLGKLAMKIAEGGGHADSAGGKLTEQVMTLTKLLHQI